MNNVLKTAGKHLAIFGVLSLGMLLMIFITGQFVTLHEDAYIDGIMSIVFVYAIILVVLVVFHVVKRYVTIKPADWMKELVTWHKKSGVFLNIALLFTLITVANSVMMVTGLDVPKTGSFAYLHLLVRTLIVALAVAVWMHKDIWAAYKALRNHFTEEKDVRKEERKAFFTRLGRVLLRRPFEASVSLFTFITVTGCVVVVIFAPLLDVQGGRNLYAALITLFFALLVVTTATRLLSNKE